MVHLFRDMDIGAGLFIRQEYAAAIPVFTRILEADPHNFMAALRLAVAYSLLPALAILVLWLLGRRSRHYEDYGAGQPIESADGKPFQGWIGPEIDSVRMDRVEFWQAPDVVYVQAWLHATAGLSASAAFRNRFKKTCCSFWP